MDPTSKATGGHTLRAYAELPIRRWFVAAPLKILAEPHSEILALYTFQTREAYETLTRDDGLIGDSSRGLAEFQEPYNWMHRQMKRRLPTYRGGLLWLWATATRQLLRDCAKHARGEVLMTVRVPRERVLLSEFSDWHQVLNRALHVPQLPGETDDEWTRRWTSLDDAFIARVTNFSSLPISIWPSELRAEIEDSWEAIFDPGTWRPKLDLQATMHDIRAEDVVRAIRIR